MKKSLPAMICTGGRDGDARVLINFWDLGDLKGKIVWVVLADAETVDPNKVKAEVPCDENGVSKGQRERGHMNAACQVFLGFGV